MTQCQVRKTFLIGNLHKNIEKFQRPDRIHKKCFSLFKYKKIWMINRLSGSPSIKIDGISSSCLYFGLYLLSNFQVRAKCLIYFPCQSCLKNILTFKGAAPFGMPRKPPSTIWKKEKILFTDFSLQTIFQYFQEFSQKSKHF